MRKTGLRRAKIDRDRKYDKQLLKSSSLIPIYFLNRNFLSTVNLPFQILPNIFLLICFITVFSHYAKANAPDASVMLPTLRCGDSKIAIPAGTENPTKGASSFPPR